MEKFSLGDIEFHHTLAVQMRFNDADALGHVNNNAYFSFYDLGKTNYFDAVRGEYLPPKSITWVLAHAEVNFLHPIFLNEKISVQTAVSHIGTKSFELSQRLVDDRGTVKSEYRSVMVGFDFAHNQSAPISDEWRQLFSKFEGRKLD